MTHQIEPSLARSFYFIRHGQTDWNLEGRMQGQTDIPLNNTGREQAHAAIPYFKDLDIDLIVSSPLSRAYETAEIINQTIKVPIKTNKDLRERSFGSNEGRVAKVVKEEYARNQNMKVQIDFNGFPQSLDAEASDDYKNRLFAALDDILTEFDSEKILISAHNGFFKVMSHILVDDASPCENGVPYFFEKRVDNTWNIQKVTL